MSKSWWNGFRKSLFGKIGGDLCGVTCSGGDCGFGGCDELVSDASFASPAFMSSSAVSEASGPGEEAGPGIVGGNSGPLINGELGSRNMEQRNVSRNLF